MSHAPLLGQLDNTAETFSFVVFYLERKWNRHQVLPICKTDAESYELLETAFGDEAMSRTSVRNKNPEKKFGHQYGRPQHTLGKRNLGELGD